MSKSVRSVAVTARVEEAEEEVAAGGEELDVVPGWRGARPRGVSIRMRK